MAARNSSDLYARSDSTGVQGSKIVLAPAVVPLKAVGTAAGDYAILFDDVAYNAASNTYSAIGTDATGSILVKTKTGSGLTLGGPLGAITLSGTPGVIASAASDVEIHANAQVYKFSSSQGAISINNVLSLGGPYGNYGIPLFTDLTFAGWFNMDPPNPTAVIFTQVGKAMTVQLRFNTNSLGVGAFGFQVELAQFSAQSANFTTPTAAFGWCESYDGAYRATGESAAGSKRVSFTSTSGFLAAAPQSFSLSYTAIIQ